MSASTSATASADSAQLIVAALGFLGSLSPQLRSKAELAFDDPQRTDWHYVPKTERKGVGLMEMNEQQRIAARRLLQSSLSPSGFAKTDTIISLEPIIRHFENGNDMRDSLRYYFTIFGTPSATSRWGLSVEGHHISLNLVINSGKLECATPLFLGANPAEVVENGGVGPAIGTRPLKQEEELALQLVQSLSPEQRERAIVSEKSPMDMKEAPKAQTQTTGALGITLDQLTPQQQTTFLALCETVIGNVSPAQAEAITTAIRETASDTSFTWFGSTQAGEPHSCRLLGPAIVVLLYKTQSDPTGRPANHTHVLWRTPGKDFGF